MRRDLGALSGDPLDILVVGGGIYGAAVLHAAAERGLTSGLIEREDFGHATSANSLKIIHGGLRYLQHLDFARMRESIRARRRFMRLAPHLVRPLPCLRPTYGRGLDSRAVAAVALAVNDLVSWDRNRGVDISCHLPRGRAISRNGCLEVLPGLAEQPITGGMLWYDAIAHDTERLTLSLVKGAVRAGAAAANYVEAHRYLTKGKTVSGVLARDLASGGELEIGARVVIDTTGPWIDSRREGGSTTASAGQAWLLSTNIVVDRLLFGEYAVGLTGRHGYVDPKAVIQRMARDFFFVPWRGRTMIGTSYRQYRGDPAAPQPCTGDVAEILAEANRLYPDAGLSVDDVCYIHTGLLPAAAGHTGRGSEPTPLTRPIIRDPSRGGTMEGLIQVAGVKYTTALEVAGRVVGLAERQLEHKPRRRERRAAAETVRRESSKRTSGVSLSPQAVNHLVEHYDDAELRRIRHYVDEDSTLAAQIVPNQSTIAAEVVHGVRDEMAVRLADIVFRRTQLGTAGHPGSAALVRCAELMAGELGWDAHRVADEVGAVERVFERITARVSA